MPTFSRPENTKGFYYDPSDSIASSFCQSLMTAADTFYSEEFLSFREALSDKMGATSDGVDEAFAFFVRYLDICLDQKADEDYWTTFTRAGIKPDDASYLAVQICVFGAMFARFHERLVAVTGKAGVDESEFCRGWLAAARDFLASKIGVERRPDFGVVPVNNAGGTVAGDDAEPSACCGGGGSDSNV